eukprot:926729-Rhodomonas_salina.1
MTDGLLQKEKRPLKSDMPMIAKIVATAKARITIIDTGFQVASSASSINLRGARSDATSGQLLRQARGHARRQTCCKATRLRCQTRVRHTGKRKDCLLYTSDAADDM